MIADLSFCVFPPWNGCFHAVQMQRVELARTPALLSGLYRRGECMEWGPGRHHSHSCPRLDDHLGPRLELFTRAEHHSLRGELPLAGAGHGVKRSRCFESRLYLTSER